jgi:hypothetical protein
MSITAILSRPGGFRARVIVPLPGHRSVLTLVDHAGRFDGEPVSRKGRADSWVPELIVCRGGLPDPAA